METEPRAAAPLTVIAQAPLPAKIPQPAPAGRRVWLRGFAFALAALIALALVGIWRIFLQPVAVAVEHPTRGPAIEAVYATGVIEAIDHARFGATVAGRVTEVLVNEGDAVSKGDVVARLDDSQARARVHDAEARLTMAEADIARDQTLTNRGVVAIQTLERAQQERDQAAAAVDLFTRQLERAGVRVEKELAVLPPALGSADQIRQVLSNLVVNAKDSMSGGGKLRLRTRLMHLPGSRDMIRIIVADSGSGISENVLDTMFEPFMTTKGERGTGLGLWIVKGIIENHGGKLRVRSKVGKGTVFAIELPAVQ